MDEPNKPEHQKLLGPSSMVSALSVNPILDERGSGDCISNPLTDLNCIRSVFGWQHIFGSEFTSLPNCYSGLGLFVTDCNNKPRVFANPPEPRKQLAKGLHAFWIVECRRRWKSGFVIVDGSVVWKVLEE